MLGLKMCTSTLSYFEIFKSIRVLSYHFHPSAACKRQLVHQEIPLLSFLALSSSKFSKKLLSTGLTALRDPGVALVPERRQDHSSDSLD